VCNPKIGGCKTVRKIDSFSDSFLCAYPNLSSTRLRPWQLNIEPRGNRRRGRLIFFWVKEGYGEGSGRLSSLLVGFAEARKRQLPQEV
jgi:hypothetical protein